MPNEFSFMTAIETLDLMRTKQVSPVEIVDSALRRAEASQSTLNAFVTLTSDLAMEAARKAEKAILAGEDQGLLTGLPLAVMAPLAALSLGVPVASVGGIVASVAIGSVALSLIGSVGAALTLGVKRSGALLSLLTLPLSMPVLIFGARATELAIKGAGFTAPLYLLGAIAVLGITLAPLAAAAAVRISLE